MGEDRNKNVLLGLSDLTRFIFPGDDDPRAWGNLSEWENGLTFVTKSGTTDTRDQAEIKKDDLFMKEGGFSSCSCSPQGLDRSWCG